MPWRVVAPATVTTLSTWICWFCEVGLRVASAALTLSLLVITSSPVWALFPMWKSLSAAKTVLKTSLNSSLVILLSEDFWVNPDKSASRASTLPVQSCHQQIRLGIAIREVMEFFPFFFGMFICCVFSTPPSRGGRLPREANENEAPDQVGKACITDKQRNRRPHAPATSSVKTSSDQSLHLLLRGLQKERL